jgi:hypothetical protein
MAQILADEEREGRKRKEDKIIRIKEGNKN